MLSLRQQYIGWTNFGHLYIGHLDVVASILGTNIRYLE